MGLTQHINGTRISYNRNFSRQLSRRTTMRANRTYALFFIQTLQNILEILLCAAFGMLLIHPLAQVYIVPAILLTLAIATTWHINNVLFKHESIVLSLLSSVKTFFTTMYDTANAFFFPSHEAKDTPKKEASENTPTSFSNVSYTNNDQKHTYTVSTSDSSLKEPLSSEAPSNFDKEQVTFKNNNSISSATITVPEVKESSVLTKQTSSTLDSKNKENADPNTKKKKPTRKKTVLDDTATLACGSSLETETSTSATPAYGSLLDKVQLHSFDSLYDLIYRFLPIIVYLLPENDPSSQLIVVEDIKKKIIALGEREAIALEETDGTVREETMTKTTKKIAWSVVKDIADNIKACKKTMQSIAQNMQQESAKNLHSMSQFFSEEEVTNYIDKYNKLQKGMNDFIERVMNEIHISLHSERGDALPTVALVQSLMPLIANETYLKSLSGNSEIQAEFQGKLRGKLEKKIESNQDDIFKSPQEIAAESVAIYACMHTNLEEEWFFADNDSTISLMKSLEILHKTKQNRIALFPSTSENNELATRSTTAHVLPIVQDNHDFLKLQEMLRILGKEISYEEIKSVSFIQRQHNYCHPDVTKTVVQRYVASHTNAKIQDITEFLKTAGNKINANVGKGIISISYLSKHFGYSYPASMTLYAAPPVFTDILSEREKYYWDRLCFYYKVASELPDDKRIYQYLGRLIAKEIHASRKNNNLEEQIKLLETILNQSTTEQKHPWKISHTHSLKVYAFFGHCALNIRNMMDQEKKISEIQKILLVLQTTDPIIALDILLDAYHICRTNTINPYQLIRYPGTATIGNLIRYPGTATIGNSHQEPKTPSPQEQQSSHILILNKYTQLRAVYDLLPPTVRTLLSYDKLCDFIFYGEAPEHNFCLNEMIGIFSCLDDEQKQKEALERFLKVYPDSPPGLEDLYKNINIFLTPHTVPTLSLSP